MADGYEQGTIDVKWWIGEVQRGKAWRREFACEDRWSDWRRWYRGQWRKGILPSNVYFKMLRTLIPRVYFRNPSVSITPKKPGWDAFLLARLLERADNTLIDNMGLKEQMKRAVQYGVMFGTGGLRLGYGAEFTPTSDDASVEDPDAGTLKLQKRVEYNDLVHPNAPWALAAHPGNTVVPAGTVDIHNCRWVCYEVVRPLDDVVDDPRLRNTKWLREGLSGMPKSRGSSLLAKNTRGGSEVRDGVTLWEIRDKKTGLVFVIAPHSNATPLTNKILFKEVDDLQIQRRINYYPLVFNIDDEVFWGIPDSIILEPQQIEKNEIRTQIMYHRRILLKKILYEKGQITPDELTKLLADDNVNIGVAVNNLNSVREIGGDAQVIQRLIECEALVDHEVQELLGLGVNQFGEYAPGSADRSATEANIVNQATMIRVDERRDACADLLTYVVQDMNHILAERWDTDMMLQVAGPDALSVWVQFSPSLFRDLPYEVKVDPDTSIPLTKQYREQKAQLLLATYKDDPLVDQYKLRQLHLAEMYGIDADFILTPPMGAPGSQQNPMQFGQAVQFMQQRAQGGPAARPTPLTPVQGGKG